LDRRHGIALDVSLTDNTSQSGPDHNNENDQAPHAEPEVSSPAMRSGIGLRRHYGLT
jgi:hypothetical protein